jgi:hypothetical protein
MPLKMQTSEKLAYRFHPHAALQAKDIERGHHQAGEPTPTFLGFPQLRLRLAVSARHCLAKTMHTALGEAGLLGYSSNTLLAVITKTLENEKAFVPKFHVGLFSEGLLNSCRNSVPQST